MTLELLPDAEIAVRALFLDKTLAGKRVSDQVLQRPCLRLTQENDIQMAHNHSGLVRVGAQAYGNTKAEARQLAYQVRSILLPPEQGAMSFFGKVGDVHFSGVTGLTGPSWLPDPDTREARYLLNWTMGYSRAA